MMTTVDTRQGLYSLAFLVSMAVAGNAATIPVDQNHPTCGAIGSPYCTISAAVTAAMAGDIIEVAPGTYVENVLINKNITLLSTGGRAVTTIRGVSGAGRLGAVQMTANRSGVQIGDVGQGFTIIGIDNGSPGLENAAVYFQGAQTAPRIIGNEIVANGEAGLLTEFGANVNFFIDQNVFSGQTFLGAAPAGCGFGMQFTLANVPRQLVVVQGTGATNATFTNNLITGAAGGNNGTCVSPPAVLGEQGNGLVTIDATGSTVTGNTFAGTTTRYSAALRCRRAGTTIAGNQFQGAGLSATVAYVHTENSNILQTIADANSFDTPLVLSPGPGASNGDIYKAPDADGDGVADTDDQCTGSDLSPTVVIGACDSGAANKVLSTGCSLADLLAGCGAPMAGDLGYVGCVRAVFDPLVGAMEISQSEYDAILDCADPDADADGVADSIDACSDSDVRPTVIVGDCDSGVANQISATGCSFADRVADCRLQSAGSRDTKRCVDDLTEGWKKAGLISKSDRDAIRNCSAHPEAGSGSGSR